MADEYPDATEILRKIDKEMDIVQQVRNILHAHNRPDTPLPNRERINCRGLLEGVIARVDDIIAKHPEKDQS